MPDVLPRMKIEAAEKSIARILAELEEATGGLVESLDVEDVETTRISDDRQQWLRRVRITLQRAPGTRWAT